MQIPKMTADDDGRYCSEDALASVREQVVRADCNARGRLAFLILSGAFNPIHTQHVNACRLARKYARDLGWAVVGAFLAPSSDAYVEAKLGDAALCLQRRKQLCQVAVEGLDWIHVCLQGEFSSNKVRRGIRRELERYLADLLNGRQLTGVEIMGSDTAVRLLDRIITQSRGGPAPSTQRGRTIFCFLRPGPEHAQERQYLAEALLPPAARLGIEVKLLDTASIDPAPGWVSSSAIRELISRGDWRVLRSKAWLRPAVLDTLQTWADHSARLWGAPDIE